MPVAVSTTLAGLTVGTVMARSENSSSHAGIPWRRDASEPWDWTTIGVQYPPPGIYQLIDPTMNLSSGIALFESLQQRSFIDLSTRALFMDVVYVTAPTVACSV